jgi:hypothetical protein
MRKSQGTSEENQTRKAKLKAPSDESRHLERTRKDEQLERPSHHDESTSSQIERVVTQEQYRTRVSQKAYELYEKRQRTTELDDWVEAERLVKTELLAEGQRAGSV